MYSVCPPIGRQEHLQVAAGDQLGVHAAGFLEQRAAQVGLAAALKRFGHAGQPPHRLEGRLGDLALQPPAAAPCRRAQALEGDGLP
jgi:hypothetical protein